MTEVACVGAGFLGLLLKIPIDLRQHRQQLLAVGRRLRDLGGHDHLRGGIDRDLRVVALHEAALVRAVRQDAALRVREVALCFIGRPGLVGIRRRRLTATLLPAGALCLLVTFGQLLLRLGTLVLGLFAGLILQRLLGLSDLLQPALAPR